MSLGSEHEEGLQKVKEQRTCVRCSPACTLPQVLAKLSLLVER